MQKIEFKNDFIIERFNNEIKHTSQCKINQKVQLNIA